MGTLQTVEELKQPNFKSVYLPKFIEKHEAIYILLITGGRHAVNLMFMGQCIAIIF
jgi:hypothetical protein